MDTFIVQGEARLEGSLSASGSKNACLPMMVAALLCPEPVVLKNVPNLKDIRTLAHLLEMLGVSVTRSDHTLELDARNVDSTEAPYDLVKTMRASIYVLGPLVARFGKARVSLPGGCAWGPRPVDLHIKGMEALGASITLDSGYIVAEAPQLKGADILLDIPSVGATGKLMMAAVMAQGDTRIQNAAQEPELPALANLLNAMGAKVEGAGTSEVHIEGGRPLHGCEFPVIPDRIEAGTFLVGAAMTGGDVTVKQCVPEHLTAALAKLRETGATVTQGEDWIRVRGAHKPKSFKVSTDYFPGFPTDLQAQFMALASVSEGTSIISEGVYHDRFTHVSELLRLGADIKVDENVAVIEGVPHLSGAQVMATDLRASAALILAGLVAHGETRISRVYHIDRGYERIERKLGEIGGTIWRGDETLVT